jgi:putative lipoic acid-binding regulatory protein
MTIDTKTAEDFPHLHHVKAIGQHADLLAAVRAAIAEHAPELPESAFSLRPSNQGRYQAVTVSLEVRSEAHLLAIYSAVKSVDGVILCL